MLKNNERKAGCTVHFVNEKLDSGSKIIQKQFLIKNADNEKILKYKTQKLEYRAYPGSNNKDF